MEMKKITPSISLILICFFTFFATNLKAQSPDQVGQWSDPIGFGIVPVAVANLPDGRLITWSSQFRDTWTGSGDGATFTEIFDPFMGPDGQALGEFTTNTDHDMFCPGINNLSDGRILSAGGTTSQRTSIYDPVTGDWAVADEMNIPRGYQGNVTLTDGSVFTVGGSWSDADTPATNGGKDAELWTEATGWVSLPGITGEDIYTANDLALELQGLYRVDNHVWLWPAPNGYLFHAGPSEMMHWIDVSGTGSIVDAGLRADDTYSMKGTTVMFDIGKILKVGGAESYGDSDLVGAPPAKDNSFVIDLNGVAYGGTPTVTQTVNNLEFSRTMHNSTVLPNGEVLVTGGLDHAEVFTDDGARLTAEIYNPTTNSWRSVAGMQMARTYHSVGILMIDGRVFVGGGGLCDSSNLDECYNHFDAEIYSPPYLFNPDGSLAARPTISAPATADYNTSINVTGSTDIQEFSLIRFSAATHSTNNEQRRIPVTFFPGTPGDYSVDIPGRELLPPGYYMLFAIDSNGVPSVAEAVQIGSDIPLSNNPSLVLDVKFDEGSGSTAADDSQYGNNGTIYDVDNDAATKVLSTDNWGTGVFGGALQTDGAEFQSNTIFEVPYSSSMSTIRQQITMMAWVNRNEVVHNAGVFSHNYPDMFFGFHNNLYKWEFMTALGQASCYSGYTPPGQWVHIAATYDGHTAKLYANGVEICSVEITSDINMNSVDPNFSSFTSSGFYETNPDPDPSYNDSGVTDELDGRIDELKVFNIALSPSEIDAYYQQGVQTGNPNIPDCSGNPIVAEYKVGAAGTWTEGNNINAVEGSEIYIRAKDYVGEYFVTTMEVDGPTFSSVDDLPGFNADTAYQIDTNIFPFGDPEKNDGLVSVGNEGTYVLTTAEGCLTVINLNVAGSCDPGDTPIYPEYQLNGVWSDGVSGETIQVEQGTTVVLSAAPNEVGDITITLPNGTEVGDDYDLGPISTIQAGTYIFTSLQGCTATLEIEVTTPDCGTFGLVTEYSTDGNNYVEGASELTLDEGLTLILGIEPSGYPFTIAGPNGNDKAFDQNDLTIPSLTPADSGTYTFTTGNGCSVTLDLTVNAVDCVTLGLVTEYSLDGDNYVEGASELTLDEGLPLILGIEPGGYPFTITGPNGNDKPFNEADLTIPNLTVADSGTYTFTTGNGCFVTLDLTVNAVDCGTFGLVTEYSLDGDTYVEGASELEVDEGFSLILGIEPSGFPFTITGPNGNDKPYDLNDLTIPSLTTADSGTYTFTTGNGCFVTLDLTVNEVDCVALGLTTEYSLDGNNYVQGATDITIDEGSVLYLGAEPQGIPYSITGPNGNDKPLNADDLIIPNVTPADSGTYTFTTGSGCFVTLDVTVNDVDCGTLGLVTEYSLDGENYIEGATDVTVDEGNILFLSILPPNLPFSITGPNGNNKAFDFNDLTISNLVPADSGTYTFTAGGDCEVSINLTVNPVDCGTLGMVTEYSINDNSFFEGATELTVDEGNKLQLSIQPQGLPYSIIGPNGNDKPFDFDDLIITTLVPADSGLYRFVSGSGCEVTLDLTVNPVDCATYGVVTEYSLNGGPFVEGASTLEAIEGDNLVLSIEPFGAAFSIDGPNGNNKPMGVNDLTIPSLTTADSGTYTFTTGSGCVVMLDLTVNTFCSTIGLETEYVLNGEAAVTGSSSVSVVEGDNISLGIIPDGRTFSVAGPNGNTKPLDLTDLVLGSATLADSGTYTFTTAEGCEVQLDLNVVEFCTALGLQTEYSLNGDTAVVGQATVAVEEGDQLSLGVFPDGLTFSIAGPNGNNKAQSTDDLVLTDMAQADAGIYTFTTAEGCEIQLEVTVGDPCIALGLQTEFSLNGDTAVVGQATVAVEEGDQLSLGVFPGGLTFSIAGPNGNNKALSTDDLVLTDIAQADAGVYTFTTDQGCEVQLEVTVSDPCIALGLQTEYSLNGDTAVVGQATVAVEEGDQLSLGVFPDGLTFSVAGPNGNNKALSTDDLVLTDIAQADAGIYTFTTDQGCEVQLEVTVTAGNQNQPPVAVIDANPADGTVPLEVNFVGSNSQDDVEVVSYTWNFDDGSQSDEANPTHIFEVSGTYEVTLTVEDAEGLTDTATITIVVEPSAEMVSILAPNPATGIARIYVDTAAEDVFVTQIHLHDSSGRYITSYVPSEVEVDGGYELPIFAVSNGVYTVQLVLNSGDTVPLRLIVRN